MRGLLKVLLVVGGVWLVLCVLAYLFQRRLQYFPDREELLAPSTPRFAGIEDVSLEADDGTALAAWYWPGVRDAAILLLHGNAGHRGHRLDWMADYHDLGWGVLLLDYRGYGGSDGSPTEEGLVADARAAADLLAARGVAKIVYYGESIGCSVAVRLAAERPPAGLVLQSGASSLADVAQRAYPFLPVRLMMKDRFDLSADLERLRAPVLCVHGGRDRIVPIEFGRRLHAGIASEDKEWYEIGRAGHNDIVWVGGGDYRRRVHAFLERVTSRE